MKKIILKAITCWTILVSILLISASYGKAASVREVSMDEMLQQCQFVFEGRVVALESQKDSPNRIHTYVTFEIQEIIKGEYPGSTITLRFLGGTVGDVTMAVSDMQFPQVGEHGIYFVESLERSQVHPLYGWSQGHFIVEPDLAGTDRVMTNDKRPVAMVVGDVPIKRMNAGFSKGAVAHGMTVDDFKRVLHDRMGAQQ